MMAAQVRPEREQELLSEYELREVDLIVIREEAESCIRIGLEELVYCGLM